MSPPTAVRRPPAGSASSKVRRSPALLMSVVALGAGLLLVAQLLHPHAFVPRITYENSTAYTVDVDVATSPRAGWMPAGIALDHSRSDAQEVYDLGDTWLFRFSAQGVTSDVVRMTRSELERANWHVTIPAAFGDGLRSRGIPAQP
ncbi:MAG: hypothetical protein ACXVLO_02875 [Acidimicrobiia bacterium]